MSYLKERTLFSSCLGAIKHWYNVTPGFWIFIKLCYDCFNCQIKQNTSISCLWITNITELITHQAEEIFYNSVPSWTWHVVVIRSVWSLVVECMCHYSRSRDLMLSASAILGLMFSKVEVGVTRDVLIHFGDDRSQLADIKRHSDCWPHFTLSLFDFIWPIKRSHAVTWAHTKSLCPQQEATFSKWPNSWPTGKHVPLHSTAVPALCVGCVEFAHFPHAYVGSLQVHCSRR